MVHGGGNGEGGGDGADGSSGGDGEGEGEDTLKKVGVDSLINATVMSHVSTLQSYIRLLSLKPEIIFEICHHFKI